MGRPKWLQAAPHCSSLTPLELWWHAKDTFGLCCPMPASDHPMPVVPSWEKVYWGHLPALISQVVWDMTSKNKQTKKPTYLLFAPIPFQIWLYNMERPGPSNTELSSSSRAGVGAGRIPAVPVTETTNPATATFLPSLWDILSTVNQHRQLASKNGTNKPGIWTKPANNGSVVPAPLLHSFQRVCVGILEKNTASVSLNFSLWHLLCMSTLKLGFDFVHLLLIYFKV